MADVVVRDFKDRLDNNRLNEKGQAYPHEGLEVTEERKQELRDKGYIAQVAEQVVDKEDDNEPKEFPFHKGGGHYLLSNGETVKGKDEAIEAEEKLKAGE